MRRLGLLPSQGPRPSHPLGLGLRDHNCIPSQLPAQIQESRKATLFLTSRLFSIRCSELGAWSLGRLLFQQDLEM